MFKRRGLWSEYKEETLYVLAMMIVFFGVFFLISLLNRREPVAFKIDQNQHWSSAVR
jgi:hypothetical protein